MSDLLEENILLISRLNFKFSYHGDCGLMSREKTEVREKSPEEELHQVTVEDNKAILL